MGARRLAWSLAALTLGMACANGSASAQQIMSAVKSRGFMQCGVAASTPGYSVPDREGRWVGFNIDYCRAVAVAVFGDAEKVRFRGLDSKDRFVAVQSGDVDLLVASATATMSRDTTLGLEFPAINYYDGQGFMVQKKLNVASAKALAGATICVAQGTTTELNLADYFRTNKLAYTLVTFVSGDETFKAFETGRCDALTNDLSGLYAARLRSENPDDFALLPDVISKEPLAPAVRQGDPQWADIVRWTHMALVTAEEYGVTKANVDEMLKSTNPEVKRLLGVEGNLGEALGLGKDWAYKVIKSQGNYGEIFDRNLGEGSRLKIARGVNALWSKGGLMYSLPMR